MTVGKIVFNPTPEITQYTELLELSKEDWVGDAFRKSTNTTPTSKLLSNARLQFSVILTKSNSVECPFLYAHWHVLLSVL